MYLLTQIQSKRILVIGDVMIDTYYTGEVKRISPEAPVPVFKKTSERSVLGGAANVAANLVAAGQAVSMMAMVGNDPNADKLKEAFHKQGIDTSLLISLDRQTTEKTRFLASNNQQVLRLDVEDTTPLTSDEAKLLLAELDRQIESFDLILLSDYLKGFLTFEFTQSIIERANRFSIPVIIDVKDQNVEKYKGATLLKPNKKELHDLTGLPVSNDEEIIFASNQLRERCNCKYVLTTCGARGMLLVGDGEPYFIESTGKEVFDVTGAGDTTIAYLAACMVNCYSMRESVDLANYAAGIQVSKVGTSLVYWNEIRSHLATEEKFTAQKILTDNLLKTFREEHKDKKIVFTNGCFDILHVGHIRYMQDASKLGDIFVVGLNSDDSVKRLKGPTRPINCEEDRAELLCALGFVDYVVIFEEDTPYELIKTIQPDVLVKGGDYLPDEVVGKDIVEERGGKLVLIPITEGKSTTNIIKKMKG